MVPNGDFSGFEKFEIPMSTWYQNFKDRSYMNSYGMLCFRDIYNITTLGSTTGGYIDGWIHKQNAVYLLKSWYPYRDRKILKSNFNFDSMLHQDTFHFFLKNQYENSATNYFYSYVTFSRKAAVNKVRVCGKNLYPLAANLSSTTRKGAYYNVGLDLMYDKNTFVYTMLYKGREQGDTVDLEKKYPTVDRPYQFDVIDPNWKAHYQVTYCNITLDTNYYARNNNLKIVLLNQFFNDSFSAKKSLPAQEIWSMPLFTEVEQEKHFDHRFKAVGEFSWIQLQQKQRDSIKYFPNDTLPFPLNEDSLFNIITDNRLSSWSPEIHFSRHRFHPMLDFWPFVKQWQTPGKYRRYADKALRNADYFLDNLSLQPEMYQKGPVAAPSILCEADTFLAFIPSGMPAIWTDLISGKILSNGDSCWISLTDTVSIEVRNNQFVDTLNYTLRQPKSPFTKDSYTLCLGDSLVFSAEAGYGIQWQKGQSSSQRYVHRYADSSNIQATLTSPLGCEYKFTTSAIKGPAINQYSLDTFLCDKPLITWDIPGLSWVSLPISGITQDKQQLNIATAADVKKNVMFTDTLTGCSVSLALSIRSNQSPNLGEDIDTVICPDNQLVIKLPTAEFHWLNGVKSTDLLNLKAAGNYSVIAANRTCADTLDIHLLKFSQIQVSVNQLNPWTCFLDSVLLFVASPNEYQYYWPGSSAATNTHTTQDTGLLHLLVKDTNDCELNIQIKPKYSCNKPVWIPNVFTPNGTALNETFGPYCISCKTIYIQIYSRWGECIYKGSEPWDGTYRGEPVPNGTYAYKIGVELWFGSNSTPAYFYGDVQVLR